MLHLSKGRWKDLQNIDLGIQVMIKAIRLSGKCASNGSLKDIGEKWDIYGCVYLRIIQKLHIWNPFNASISSSANFQLSDFLWPSFPRGKNSRSFSKKDSNIFRPIRWLMNELQKNNFIFVKYIYCIIFIKNIFLI